MNSTKQPQEEQQQDAPEEIGEEAIIISNNQELTTPEDSLDHHVIIKPEIREPPPQQPTSKQQKQSKPLTPSSPATTPEPTSLTSALTSWYSSGSSSNDVTTQDSKNYKAYVQNIDKCLKNFEYSIEWPDLISALTKLNKVISSYNTTITPSPSLPLPRTNLVTKRLAQCLHPNLPSGVHLKTLETFDLIFQGFRSNSYDQLKSDLFNFTSGLLPLWSYASISVKPKLLYIYEHHLLQLPHDSVSPALPGLMLSLFTGLLDDGVEQDIKIRVQKLLDSLANSHESEYNNTVQCLISTHPSIHLPIINHITQTQPPYQLPASSLMQLISSPNTLVQRNALELLKSYNHSELPHDTQVHLMATALTSLLKRDMSITRRVFSFIEDRQGLLTESINYLIQSPDTDGNSLTRILSTILDNPEIKILDDIIAPVVKYLMKCEYNVTVSFLSTINSNYLCDHFTDYLFGSDSLEELENRVIVYNYIVKLRIFEFNWGEFFGRLAGLEDSYVRVVLQMVRLHYNSHDDGFVMFFNYYMGLWFDLNDFELLCGGSNTTEGSELFDSLATPNPPPTLTKEFDSSAFEFVCELVKKSNPDGTALKYIVLSACTVSKYTEACISVFIHFQTEVASLVYNTHVVGVIFKYCYGNNKSLLDKLKFPEKYLLSELHSDKEFREVIELDLSSFPLVVLKLVDPVTMGVHPYRRFVAREFVRRNPGLVLGSVLKYLEFQVENKDTTPVKSEVYVRAKSESNLLVQDGGGEEQQQEGCNLIHANSVVVVAKDTMEGVVNDGDSATRKSTTAQIRNNACYYDSARVSTLLEKLNFVIEVYEEFLERIDLVVLLSKLTVLSTIQNCNETEDVTLEIQTRALRLIARVVKTHGEASHSFVYDSLISHLNSRKEVDEGALLWELYAVDVIVQFFKFDLENYTLALVVQKCLGGGSSSDTFGELEEATQLKWLRGVGGSLDKFKKHYNAIVLICYTSVCRNLLDKNVSCDYGVEGVKFLSVLVAHVLRGSSVGVVEGDSGSSVSGSGGGFLSSLFGGSVSKDSVVDEREALRSALLGKVELLVKICCKWRGVGRVGVGVVELVKFLMGEYEGKVIDGVVKCFDTVGLEVTVNSLRVGGRKIVGAVLGGSNSSSNCDKVVDCINFLIKYIRYDRGIDVGSIVGVCKASVGGGYCREALSLVNEYLKCGGGGSGGGSRVGKELQDVVVKIVESCVEKREFYVLEAFVPGVFDLVWGEVAAGGSSDECGGGGSGSVSGSIVSVASSASVRDQKVIVNVVHGIVVAVLVAVKGRSADNINNYTSALKVLEQISHHSYLRKAWKKEIFDLITNEPTFFYFTPDCLAIWKVIVDNLFTQDRSTFSELITRLTQTTQMSTSALSIFSPKDSEIIETRASLLKRLAFVIHSSEKDQYAKYITNIQEKIAEALKIGGGSGSGGLIMSVVPPGVSSSVFLCFRVMVLKFNCNILVSLWPIIVHEVVTVINSLQTTLDEALAMKQNGQDIVQPPQPILALYLQTLKLLNFLFTIPSTESQIPHFQLYKWAFTSEACCNSESDTVDFVPYINRLRSTAGLIYPGGVNRCNAPLRVRRVNCLEELCCGFGGLEKFVGDLEWEGVDFCGGLSGNEGYSCEDNVGDTDL